MAPSPQRQPEKAEALGRRTTTGMLWLTAQTVGTKVLTLGQQIILSYLLVPEDFGLFGLAMTVLAICNFVVRSGLREILIQRHRHFRRWVTPVFWMGITLAAGSGLLMALAAPIASIVYDVRNLVPLILLLALTPLLQALAIPPTVRIQCDMAFGRLARIGLLAIALQLLVAGFLAAFGLGAFALVLSRLAMQGFRTVAVWRISKPPIQMRLHIRRWKYLLGDSSRMMGGNAGVTLMNQGDYMMLGVFHADSVVGLYYWGFNLSTQSIQLVLANLNNTLTPALSKLQAEPERQISGFVRGATLASFVGVPLCLLQAAVAEPAVRLVFDSKWYDAIPILQVLSLGMAVRLCTGASTSLLVAQGRFGLRMLLSWAEGGTVLAAAAIGANLGAGLAVAICVTAAITFAGPLRVYCAVHRDGKGLSSLWRIVALPVAIGLAALAVSLLVQRAATGILPTAGWLRDACRALIGTGAMFAAYAGLASLYAPNQGREIHHRLKDLVGRRLRRSLS